MKPGAVIFACLSIAGNCAGLEILDPNWRVEAIGEGIKPSFDFAADGTIHVMGMDESAGIVWHAKAATLDGPWNPVTVGSESLYGPGDIRVDPATGEAHMAWHSHSAESPNHVMIAPDGGVSGSVIPSPGHDGWDNSQIISPTGVVHMASVDPTIFGAIDSLQYGAYDGNGWTFQNSVPNSGTFCYGLNTSIDLDSSGNPHILFCRAADWSADGDLVHATLGSSGWVFDTIDGGSPVGRFATLAIDADDRLHGVWLDINAGDTTQGTVRYGTRDPMTGSWTVTTLDSLRDVLIGFSHARKSTSIALDSAGDPHVAYADTTLIRYAVRRDGIWQTTTVLRDLAAIYKSLVVLRLDGQDRPGIVFWQSDGGDNTVRLARPRIPPPRLVDLGLEITYNATAEPPEAVIRYRTAAPGTYQLEWTDDLAHWNPVGDPLVAGPESVDVMETDSTSEPERTYRVVVVE